MTRGYLDIILLLLSVVKKIKLDYRSSDWTIEKLTVIFLLSGIAKKIDLEYRASDWFIEKLNVNIHRNYGDESTDDFLGKDQPL